jgi:hypothetical protein
MTAQPPEWFSRIDVTIERIHRFRYVAHITTAGGAITVRDPMWGPPGAFTRKRIERKAARIAEQMRHAAGP